MTFQRKAVWQIGAVFARRRFFFAALVHGAFLKLSDKGRFLTWWREVLRGFSISCFLGQRRIGIILPGLDRSCDSALLEFFDAALTLSRFVLPSLSLYFAVTSLLRITRSPRFLPRTSLRSASASPSPAYLLSARSLASLTRSPPKPSKSSSVSPPATVSRRSSSVRTRSSRRRLPLR